MENYEMEDIGNCTENEGIEKLYILCSILSQGDLMQENFILVAWYLLLDTFEFTPIKEASINGSHQIPEICNGPWSRQPEC